MKLLRTGGLWLVSSWIAACAFSSTSNRPPPGAAPVASESSKAAPIERPDEADDVVEVETSTDAEFVLSLPIEDASDRELGDVRDTVEPILADSSSVAFGLPEDRESIAFWREYLSGRGRKYFERWLARSTRYVPIFWEVLDRYQLPRDLVFLAMVESGFSTSAYSWARAAGPWQFVASTGRRYGLRIDFWVDDRRDFEKATDAAARHLRDLYERYGDWFLAFAAYNAGAGKVNRAIRRYRTEDFWALSERRYLRRETKQYVPKILAAAQLAKDPGSWDLGHVEYLPPWRWTTVTVTTATSLQAFARACREVEPERLRQLNPALRARVTPPGETFEVRVPATVSSTCAEAMRRPSRHDPYAYRYARITEADTLERLARRYRTDVAAILEFNDIEPDQFFDFDEMVIPVPRTRADSVPIVNPPRLPFRPPVYGPQGVRLVRYRVRAGDSLWKVAQRFRVGIPQLLRWNGLRRSQVLRIGQRLRIYLGSARAVRRARRVASRQPARPLRGSEQRKVRPPAVDSGRTHRVEPGESFWSVANDHGVTVAGLRSLNALDADHVLQPGDVLRLPKARQRSATRSEPPAGTGPPPPGTHRVRPGESLWSIGQRYGLSVGELRRLNELQPGAPPLQPGQLLRIRPR
ncbi:MAG TPA: LysM peptidoglycan-binding domain-containing protein [Myxococcales bacterium LLY-WYZ-16_1]|nr:LysM peptidoglycan-binding domain-containing protein [Myxococcales bacterium LLY-WYZ-16_1]